MKENEWLTDKLLDAWEERQEAKWKKMFRYSAADEDDGVRDNIFDSYSFVPPELKETDQWVCWRREMRNGRSTKVPYNPLTGVLASSTDANTWSTFNTCCNHVHNYDGIGFVLTAEDEYGGIDIDNCIDEQGHVTPEAQAIVDSCQSYWEISPSGRGLRCFGEFDSPPGRKWTKTGVEIYTKGRYLTVTGNRFGNSTCTTEDIGESIHSLVDSQDQLLNKTNKVIKTKDIQTKDIQTTQVLEVQDLSDKQQKLIDKAFKSKVGEKIKKLWAGDWESCGFASQSEADLSLLSYLGFYFPSSLELEQVFSHSGLGKRDKWLSRQDYRERQITLSLGTLTEHYSPGEPVTDLTIWSDDVDKIKPVPINDKWFPKAIRSLRNELMNDLKVDDHKREDLMVAGVFNDILRSVLGKRVLDRYELSNNYIGAGLSIYCARSGRGKSSTYEAANQLYTLAGGIDTYALPSGKTTMNGMIISIAQTYDAYETKIKSANGKYKTERIKKDEAKEKYKSNPNGIKWLCDEGADAIQHLLGGWSQGAYPEQGRLTQLVESAQEVANASGTDRIYAFDTCNQFIFATQPDQYVKKINPMSPDNLKQGITARMHVVFSECLESSTVDKEVDIKSSLDGVEIIENLIKTLKIGDDDKYYIEATFADIDLENIADSLPCAEKFIELYPEIWTSWRKNILRMARRNAMLWALLDGVKIQPVQSDDKEGLSIWKQYASKTSSLQTYGTLDCSQHIHNAIAFEVACAINHFVIAHRLEAGCDVDMLDKWIMALRQSKEGYLRNSDMIRVISKSNRDYHPIKAELEKAVHLGLLVESQKRGKGRPATVYSLPQSKPQSKPQNKNKNKSLVEEI